jgi:hypothetical protein
MLTIILLSVCAAIAIYLFLRRSKDDPRLPPGPKGYPLIGNVLDISMNAGKFHFTVSDWAKKYGDIFSYKMFNRQFIVINSPDTIREALSKPYDWKLADRPPTFVGSVMMRSYKDVIMALFDSNWQPRRKAMHRMIKLYGEGGLHNELDLVKEMQDAVKTMRETNGQPFQPNEVILTTLVDIVAGVVSFEMLLVLESLLLVDTKI